MQKNNFLAKKSIGDNIFHLMMNIILHLNLGIILLILEFSKKLTKINSCLWINSGKKIRLFTY